MLETRQFSFLIDSPTPQCPHANDPQHCHGPWLKNVSSARPDDGAMFRLSACLALLLFDAIHISPQKHALTTMPPFLNLTLQYVMTSPLAMVACVCGACFVIASQISAMNSAEKDRACMCLRNSSRDNHVSSVEDMVKPPANL